VLAVDVVNSHGDWAINIRRAKSVTRRRRTRNGLTVTQPLKGRRLCSRAVGIGSEHGDKQPPAFVASYFNRD
jgi:hypothetical protein